METACNYYYHLLFYYLDALLLHNQYGRKQPKRQDPPSQPTTQAEATASPARLPLVLTNTSMMNTEAMPLMKHDHYQQQGGANFPMEEKAPFLATTTTTKTRVTRAALVLCVVAAVVVGVTFLSGHIMAGPVRAESVKSVSQLECLCYVLCVFPVCSRRV